MMKHERGFLLIDALIAAGMIAMVGLAALEALSAVDAWNGKSRDGRAVAACAEERLLVALSGGAPAPSACTGRVAVRLDRRVAEGLVEEIAWTITPAGGRPDRFVTARYAQ